MHINYKLQRTYVNNNDENINKWWKYINYKKVLNAFPWGRESICMQTGVCHFPSESRPMKGITPHQLWHFQNTEVLFGRGGYLAGYQKRRKKRWKKRTKGAKNYFIYFYFYYLYTFFYFSSKSGAKGVSLFCHAFETAKCNSRPESWLKTDTSCWTTNKQGRQLSGWRTWS